MKEADRIQKFKQVANTSLSKMKKHMENGEKQLCRQISLEMLQTCKYNLKNVRNPDEELLCLAHTWGILFSGLKDYIELGEFIDDPTWFEKHKLVERVWTKMWDCRQRIEYFCGLSLTQVELLKGILASLNHLEDIFIEKFGPGVYCSPEILYEKVICNVCGADYRSCKHLSGKFYNEIQCRKLPQAPSLKAVAFVSTPEDPRCRIWPWQENDDGT